MKIDANGVKQWDKRFGGTGADQLNSLRQTKDGGYILGGYSYSGMGGDKTEASRGADDYWIVKINANGVKEWDKRFGGSSYDVLKSLQQTTDNGYILGGYSYSDISGDKTESNQGLNDYWIVKINAKGIKQWDKRFGGNNFDELSSLQQTLDGGYILGGSSLSDIGGDKTEYNLGYLDYWTVKVNADGVKQWDKSFGGAMYDELHSLQQTTDGGYILGGYSESGIFGGGGRGNFDYLIVKTDANGIKQWDKYFGGIYSDYLYSLQQTSDGGYILGGYSASDLGGDKTQESRGGYDYWIVKIGCPPNTTVTPSGSLDICQTGFIQLHAYSAETYKYQWVKNGQKIKGATDSVYTVKEPGSYRVVVYTSKECGNVSKPIKVINSCGKTDNNISVSPNPSHGNIIIAYNSSKTSNVQLNLFDKTGNLLFTKTEYAVKGSNTYQLNLSNLINGIYNLQINTAVGQQKVKFIIEK